MNPTVMHRLLIIEQIPWYCAVGAVPCGMTAIFALLGRDHDLSQYYRTLPNNALN